MVNRDKIVEGTVVQVFKAVPGSPGPKFNGKLGMGERLDIMSSPFTASGLNLVRVKREKTGEVVELLFGFIRFYCKMQNARRKRAPKTIPAPPPVMSVHDELTTIIPPGDPTIIPPPPDED